ncbi:phage terminase small subunit [Gordonia paraffinivorans]|uniref:phage terminase small subunit n=1 Tax=Gordonia paraffinivorans TaxID=175628 RepID=UPI00144619C6|nr:hypothetical protein [Gordonia paraffinivorans]
MGTRGPIGKRDDERVRRNKPDQETQTISVIGTVQIPELGDVSFTIEPDADDIAQQPTNTSVDASGHLRLRVSAVPTAAPVVHRWSRPDTGRP